MGGFASAFGVAVSLAIGGVAAVAVGLGSLVWIRRRGLDRAIARPVPEAVLSAESTATATGGLAQPR
jgi:hypothetical protein